MNDSLIKLDELLDGICPHLVGEVVVVSQPFLHTFLKRSSVPTIYQVTLKRATTSCMPMG
jgi:hypothetical protein